jgi:hypothetical protein
MNYPYLAAWSRKMEIDFFEEPELEFGLGKHIDIRFGLMHYSPVDYDSLLAPKQIKIGIVGTTESVEGVSAWFEKCRNEIAAKKSNQPNLFPKFPGFRSDNGFRSTLLLDSGLERVIPNKEFQKLENIDDINKRIEVAVELFQEGFTYLKDKANPDVFICAIPQTQLELTSHLDDLDEDNDSKRLRNQLDFHDLLKAKTMKLGIPIQLIIPSTYDNSKRKRQKGNPALLRVLQDEATRAWNLHTAIYYKAKGVPWRLVRNPSEYSTCYIGVSFYRTLDGSSLRTSVAQVFNERGEGVVVRGGYANYDKNDKQVHLAEKDAQDLIVNSLTIYKKEHGNFPARVVIHKSSTYKKDEQLGFLNGGSECGIERTDLLSVDKSFIRLFRTKQYPPLRGTFISLDSRSHLLYTRGSVDFFATYPGMYVPKTLSFQCARIEETPKFLAKEILALTKMNWNNTQFDGGQPITLRASRQVSDILRYTQDGDTIAPYYRFYM